MKYKYHFLAALTAGYLAAGFAASQLPLEHHAHIAFDNPPSKFIVAKGKPLTIRIKNIGSHGVLALQPIQASDVTEQLLVVKAWAMTNVEPDSKAGTRGKTIGLGPLAPHALQFNDNTLELDGGANKTRNATVHITVPDSIDTRISLNGKTMHAGPLQTDILLRGTEIVEGKVPASEGRAALYSLLGAIHGDMAPRIDPDPVSMQTGDVVRLSWANLVTLATERIEPNINALENNSGSDPQWALVDVFVDESGLVTKSLAKPFGNAALGAETAQALGRWRFQPFVLHERPTKVRSTVYVLVKNGSILLRKP